MDVALLLTAIFAPVAAGVLTLPLPNRQMLLRVLLSTAGPAVSLWALASYYTRFGTDRGRVAVKWMPQLEIDLSFTADALGLFFAFLVAGIGLLILVYGRAYLGPEARALKKFYPLMGMFMSAMLGLVLADDFLLMLMFWEATSVSSFLLIGWDHTQRAAVRNALQAFVVTGFGGLALLGGLVLLGVLSGDWSFSELDGVTSSGPMIAAFLLIYSGIAAKSAQWPVHFWLPGAMLAPTPISAYLHSAAMVKAGIYLLARFWPDLSPLPIWPAVVITIGTITMVLGVYIALQRDVLKQILAYTTVSQLGLLATAFGLSAYHYHDEHNLVWGNAQILNHALYKAPLFMLAGACAHTLGKAELARLRSAWHLGGADRLYAALFLAALVALAALPGTFSFFAKEAFLYQIVHALDAGGTPLLWLVLVAAVLTSVFNVAILVRFAQVFFTRPSQPPEPYPQLKAEGEGAAHGAEEDHAHESPVWTFLLWFPAALLIALQYFGGIFGPAAARLLAPFEASPYYLDASSFSLLYVATHPSLPLLLSGIGIAGGMLLGFSPLLRRFQGDWHDHIFPAGYSGVLNGGGYIFGLVQTGALRWYIIGSLLTLVGIAGWVGYVDWRSQDLAWIPGMFDVPDFRQEPGGWLLCGLICTCAVTMIFVRERAARVLVLGTVGFSVTGLFYVYAAPDLALTQLSVEIVSLILFLLVLNLLPRRPREYRTLVPVRLLVAATVGVTAFAITLWASTGPRPQRPALLADGTRPVEMGTYFLRNSYEGTDTAHVPPQNVGAGVVDRGDDHLDGFGSHVEAEPVPPMEESVDAEAEPLTVHKGGGGANVVNVILVDFRGFDTLGEITVLALAALGVWTLLRKPPSRGDRDPTDNRSPPFDDSFDDSFIDPYARQGDLVFHIPRAAGPLRSERIASPILRTAVRLLIPLAVVFAFYLFFKGHQSPGGGFVAGLASAVALLVYRMCFGADALYTLLPVRERTLIATGLLLAVATAAAPLLFGLPLLTSNNGYLPLPGGGSFHWATVMVFDAGVYLVVVGSVVGMIDAIARELE